MTIASLDPGSARAALVFGDAAPLRIASARVFPVDASTPDALAATLAPIVEALGTARPSVLLLERGQPYSPGAVTPQAAASIARQLILQDRLCCAVVAACGALEIPVEETPRASWAPRVLLAAGLPGSPRGDPQVRAALTKLLDAESMAHVVGADVADAAGMLVAYTLPAKDRARSRGRYRPDMTDEEKEPHRKSARESMRRALNRKRVEQGLPPKVYVDRPPMPERIRAVLATGSEMFYADVAKAAECSSVKACATLRGMVEAGEVTQPRRGWYVATSKATP